MYLWKGFIAFFTALSWKLTSTGICLSVQSSSSSYKQRLELQITHYEQWAHESLTVLKFELLLMWLILKILDFVKIRNKKRGLGNCKGFFTSPLQFLSHSNTIAASGERAQGCFLPQAVSILNKNWTNHLQFQTMPYFCSLLCFSFSSSYLSTLISFPFLWEETFSHFVLDFDLFHQLGIIFWFKDTNVR